VAAIPALTEALVDSDVEVQVGAAELLGRCGGKAAAAVPTLIGILADRHAHGFVRMTVIMTLGEIGPAATSAAPALIDTLGDSSMCTDAVRALVAIGDTAMPALVRALRHGQPTIRLGAAYVLGSLGDASVVASLVEILEDPDEGVRRAAAEALVSIRNRLTK